MKDAYFRFTMLEGVVEVSHPAELPPEGVEEMRECFDLIIKRMRRRANKPKPTDPTMCQDCGAIHAPGQNTLCSR